MGWAARANPNSRANNPARPPKPVVERPSFQYPFSLEQSLSMLVAGARRKRRGLVTVTPPPEPPAEVVDDPSAV
jgi:hypothetical protein